MIKFRSKRFSRSNSTAATATGEIQWELRPGGMLVQKRDKGEEAGVITVRVSTVVSQYCHDVTIHPTSSFGELKMVLALITNLEAKEQRLVYKGKEREDEEHLHMVGVRDNDKVLLLERKLKLRTTADYRTPICTV